MLAIATPHRPTHLPIVLYTLRGEGCRVSDTMRTESGETRGEGV